jgi:hypothetical protein
MIWYYVFRSEFKGVLHTVLKFSIDEKLCRHSSWNVVRHHRVKIFWGDSTFLSNGHKSMGFRSGIAVFSSRNVIDKNRVRGTETERADVEQGTDVLAVVYCRWDSRPICVVDIDHNCLGQWFLTFFE